MSLRKVLFIGPPGSGKGTQAKLLIPLGFKHISTGDLIREGYDKNDPIVMPYKDHIDSGEFLPDAQVFQLISQSLDGLNDSRGYILDGAIRNLAQAQEGMRLGLLEDVLVFDIFDEQAKSRLIKRYRLQGRRDDRPDVTRKRLRTYHEQTEPLIGYLNSRVSSHGDISVYTINASSSIEKIHEEILGVLRLK